MLRVGSELEPDLRVNRREDHLGRDRNDASIRWAADDKARTIAKLGLPLRRPLALVAQAVRSYLERRGKRPGLTVALANLRV